MKKTGIIYLLTVVLIWAISIMPTTSFSQRSVFKIPKDGNVFLDPESGNDANIGTVESPLRTLFEAAERVNRSQGSGTVTLYLSEGIYGLDANVTFHSANWHFTKEHRLIIRAVSLPDDEDWNPGR